MAPRLKALRKDEDLAAIPVDQPVLVELEPVATALIADNDEGEQEQSARVEKTNDGGGEDPGVKALKEQMAAKATADAAENKRLQENARKANERAEAAERQVREANTAVADAETSAIESGLAAAQRERDVAKQDVKLAFESADADKLADAQERLGRAAADIRDFEKSAAHLAERKAQDERQAKEPQRQAGPVDVNAGIDANPNLMPVEKEWLKQHQDAVLDPNRNQELAVAYTHATRAGHIRGSEPYFKFIEQFMGYAKTETRKSDEDDDDNNGRESIVSAPVSRDNRSNASGQQSGSRVTLSPEQRELARSMGLSDVEYARGVVQMSADKKSNPEKYFRN